MRDMIAYCGLDCEKCDAYLATINDDQALRKKTAKLWASLNNAPILPEHINCEGCRVDGIKTVYCDSLCAIRQCASKKSVVTCGDCPDLKKCQTVKAIVSNDPDALKNLKASRVRYMKKIIGIILIVIGIVTATIDLILKVNRKMSVSIIGGADGPTSLFVAGKIGSISTSIGITVDIVLFITGIFMIIRNK